MWFQKISIPPPQRVIGNSKGDGVLKAKIFKGKYDLNWKFQRGGGSNQKPSMGGVWIFSGTTQCGKNYAKNHCFWSETGVKFQALDDILHLTYRQRFNICFL